MLPNEVPVFRGYPEELVCEADGHPPPEIRWSFSPDTVPRQSGTMLIVTDAGTYNCTATNEVGTAFRVVEVILKGNNQNFVVHLFKRRHASSIKTPQ